MVAVSVYSNSKQFQADPPPSYPYPSFSFDVILRHPLRVGSSFFLLLLCRHFLLLFVLLTGALTLTDCEQHRLYRLCTSEAAAAAAAAS